jgi:hypothetical protein
MFLSGCFVFDGKHFRHSPCADFSVAKFSDDAQNNRFSNSYCGAKFICGNAAVIPSQRIKLVFGLRRRCRGYALYI